MMATFDSGRGLVHTASIATIPFGNAKAQGTGSVIDSTHSKNLLATALQNAISVIDKACLMNRATFASRIAPLQYDDIGSAIMQAQAVFVLQSGAEHDVGVDEVWVPLSLAIARETDPDRERDLKQMSQYDIFITVNSNTANAPLVTGDSNCSWVVHPSGGSFYLAAASLCTSSCMVWGFTAL